MTPDSRRLSEAALAAIGERIDEKPPRGLGDYAFQADRDRRALLDHAAYLAERLGEAERENERGIITDDKSIESAFLEYWGERSDDKPNRMAAHRAYCYRAFQEAKTLADLRAQLARERADHAATVAARDDAIASLRAELKLARGLCLTAEGQVAELLHFASNDGRLGAYLNTVIDDLQIDGKGQYFRDLFGKFSEEMAALAATPSHGTAAKGGTNG